MSRLSVFAVPILLFFFAGCGDQTSAPDMDLVASFAKGGKPGKPPPPTAEPANPVIAYDLAHRKKGGLWVVDADGENATRIYDAGRRVHSSWSPNGDGKVVPYEILLTLSPLVGVQKIEVWAEEGSAPRLGEVVALSDGDYHAAEVSPNGQDVAAVRWEDGSTIELQSLDEFVDTDPLYVSETDHLVWAVTWNQDGSRIALLEDHGDFIGEYALKILPVSGGDPVTVHTFTATDNPPRRISWSRVPGHEALVFDYDGVMFLLELDADFEPVGPPVSLGPGFGPVWSPDDTQIAYDDRAGVYIKTLDGSKSDLSIGGQWYADWRR